jgi:hypothetical protein
MGKPAGRNEREGMSQNFRSSEVRCLGTGDLGSNEVRIREIGAVFEIFAVRSLSAALFLPLLVATACCFAFSKESSAIKLVDTYIQRGDPSSVDAKYYPQISFDYGAVNRMPRFR